MSHPRYVFGDTETTGLDPATGDRLVEGAFVEVVDMKLTGRRLHFYANPDGRPVGETERIHGLSDAFLGGQAAFREHAAELVAFLEGAVFVAHNAEFDIKFIKAELARCGLSPTWASVEDTLVMARLKHPGSTVSLDALMSRYGVDSSKRVKHGALIDTELLIEVYAHLTGRTTLRIEPVVRPGAANSAGWPPTGTAFMPDSARQVWFPARAPSLAADDEMLRHMQFVEKSVKNSIWLAIFAEWAGAEGLTTGA
jgi:DNA polymerase-3 subunit epsilon